MRKVTLFIGLMLISSFCLLPPNAQSADTGQQTSSIFGYGESLTVELNNVNKGEILQWRWESNTNLDFLVIGPNGTTYSKPFYGIAYVTEPGNWTFIWTNNNIAASATVTYRLQSFSVFPDVISPVVNSTIHSKTAVITGTYPPRLSSLQYSLDNITYSPASKTGANWSAQVELSEGRNIVYLKYEYTYYDSTYVGYRELNYTVSTFWINNDNPLSLGAGSVLMIILVILGVVLIIILQLIKRSKRKGQIIQEVKDPVLVPVQPYEQPPPPPPPPGT